MWFGGQKAGVGSRNLDSRFEIFLEPQFLSCYYVVQLGIKMRLYEVSNLNRNLAGRPGMGWGVG